MKSRLIQSSISYCRLFQKAKLNLSGSADRSLPACVSRFGPAVSTAEAETSCSVGLGRLFPCSLRTCLRKARTSVATHLE